MLQNLNILEIASAMARHAVQRHSVIAENIANSDTPGFKAKDLEPFSEAFARVQRSEAADFRVERITTGEPSPNGNTVSLEDQMARSAGALRDHETAMTIYSKAMTMLRTSIGRR